jgi:excisionase family DNA binding protein
METLKPVIIQIDIAALLAPLQAQISITLEKEISKLGRHLVEKPMTMKQAAAFLNVSPRTLSRYVADGDIKPHKVGKNPMFYASEINAQIKGIKRRSAN